MPDKSSRSLITSDHSRWTELIEELRDWSSSDPEWESTAVQTFVYEVRLIAEEKCKEREDAGRYQLQQAIIQLKENHKAEFRIFDIDDTNLDYWSSANCPNDKVAKQINLIQSVIEKLEHRIKLESREPHDFQERQKIQKNLSTLEETIYGLIKQIDRTFVDIEREGTTIQGVGAGPDGSHASDPVTSDSVTKEKSNVDSIQETDIGRKVNVDISSSDSKPEEGPLSEDKQVKSEISLENEESIHTQDEVTQDQDLGSVPRDDIEAVTMPDDGNIDRDTEGSIKTSHSRQIEDSDQPSLVSKEIVSPESDAIPDSLIDHQGEVDHDSPKQLRKPKIGFAKSKPSKGKGKSDVTEDSLQSTIVQSTDVTWESFGWDLLESDDWSGAYWLARSLEANGQETPVPHQLLVVLQGSRWLEYDKDVFVSDLLQIASEWSPQKKNPQRLLGLAAALRPCLIAPHTGLVGWLPRQEEINPGLGVLCDVIREFADKNVPLRTPDLQGIVGRASRRQSIEELTVRARAFLAENLRHRLMFQRATKVLHLLVRAGGDLHSLLVLVVRNQPDQVERARLLIEGLSERKQIVDRINQLDRDKPNLKPIIGAPLNQLVRIVEEAVGIARRWCDLNEQEFGLRQRGDWWDDHVSKLLVGVRDILPKVENELETMQSKGESRDDVILGYVLRSAVAQIASMLGVEKGKKEDDSSSWMSENCLSLTEALTRRLLFIPEIGIDEEGNPSNDRETDIGRLLCQSVADKRSLVQVIDMWIERQDFPFAEVLLNGLDDEELSQEYGIKYNACLKKSESDLQHEVASVRDSIEKGIVDGLLNEEERTSFSAELESVTAGMPRHFSPLFQRLKNIDANLNKKLEDRMQELNHQWHEYKNRLAETNSPDLQMDAIMAFFRNASENQDTRVMEEGLARLRDYFQGATEWNKEWFERPAIRDVLVEFNEASPLIDSGLSSLTNFDVLTTRFVVSGQTWNGLKFGQLPQTRRDEACLGLRSWHQLKRRRGNQADYRRHIKILMGYLGFHISDHESAVKMKSHDKDWVYFQVVASSSDLARPIPQMGSQANGRYDVVCMWDRPGASSIRATLSELKLDKTTVLVFYLGRLSEKQRHNLAYMTMNHNMTMAALDEILLVFLAASEDNRLPDFIRCSLPYSAFNPYMPFQAGNVPPEMFYGRDDKIRQLIQNEGSCMVYGGRQLGKSALLRKVEREFHLPEREQYAWVEDVKLLGEVTSGEQPARLWIRLRDGFKNQSLLGSKITTNQPEVIIKHIRQAMGSVTYFV